MATPDPVTLDADNPDSWTSVVETHPYRVFPIVQEGRPLGVVTRDRWEILPVPVFGSNSRLEEAEARFLETTAGVVLMVDGGGFLKGILTLHDLLRAQASLGD